MREEIQRADSRLYLTHPDSTRNISFMAGRLKDITSGLVQQADTDTDAMCAMLDELNDLRPKYQRYRELSEQLKAREERAQIVAGMLSSAVKEESDAKTFIRVLNKLEKAGLRDVADSDEVPLWKLIREILRQVPEMQIVDVESILRSLEIKTTRQTVDSALATHSGVFSVRKKGRQKFISLKGV